MILALNRPSEERRADPEVAHEVRDLREAINALELALRAVLLESSEATRKLRGDVAAAIRLAFLGFKDLDPSHIEELMVQVFGKDTASHE
jgi:hypothetical protein